MKKEEKSLLEVACAKLMLLSLTKIGAVQSITETHLHVSFDSRLPWWNAPLVQLTSKGH